MKRNVSAVSFGTGDSYDITQFLSYASSKQKSEKSSHYDVYLTCPRLKKHSRGDLANWITAHMNLETIKQVEKVVNDVHQTLLQYNFDETVPIPGELDWMTVSEAYDQEPVDLMTLQINLVTKAATWSTFNHAICEKYGIDWEDLNLQDEFELSLSTNADGKFEVTGHGDSSVANTFTTLTEAVMFANTEFPKMIKRG